MVFLATENGSVVSGFPSTVRFTFGYVWYCIRSIKLCFWLCVMAAFSLYSPSGYYTPAKGLIADVPPYGCYYNPLILLWEQFNNSLLWISLCQTNFWWKHFVMLHLWKWFVSYSAGKARDGLPLVLQVTPDIMWHLETSCDNIRHSKKWWGIMR